MPAIADRNAKRQVPRSRGVPGAFLLLACLMLYGAAGQALSPEMDTLLTADEKKWLAAHTEELRVGVDPNFAPVEWVDAQGRHMGMAADYMAALRERLGLKTRLVSNLPWGQVLDAIRNKSLDLLSAPIRTDEREAYIAFSEPIIDLPAVIITRSDRADIHSMQDLAGKKVAVVQDWAYAEWVVKAPSIAAQKRMEVSEALEAVAFGEADAYFGDMASATVAINRTGLSNLKVASYAPFTAHICIGIRKDWPELASIVSKTLSTIGPREREAIRDRWVILHPGVTVRQVISLLVPAVIVGIILTLLVVNRRLRREVRQRVAMEQRAKEELALRLEKESMLIQQSRMAAMGEMIGAIAHQWRQPLNMVGATIQDIKDAHDHQELDRAYLDRNVDAAMRQIRFMSRTIDDFRDFLRTDRQREAFDVVRAAEEVAGMLEHQLAAHGISCRLASRSGESTLQELEHPAPGEQPLRVVGFGNEMKQVFLNLIVNAKEAILDRRRRSGVGVPKQGVIIIDFAREGSRVVIRVTDNGGGIPDHLMERIFEPYFSTKERELGTGIGLYMSKMIIERNMGGRLTARNVSGGSEFRIEV